MMNKNKIVDVLKNIIRMRLSKIHSNLFSVINDKENITVLVNEFKGKMDNKDLKKLLNNIAKLEKVQPTWYLRFFAPMYYERNKEENDKKIDEINNDLFDGIDIDDNDEIGSGESNVELSDYDEDGNEIGMSDSDGGFMDVSTLTSEADEKEDDENKEDDPVDDEGIEDIDNESEMEPVEDLKNDDVKKDENDGASDDSTQDEEPSDDSKTIDVGDGNTMEVSSDDENVIVTFTISKKSKNIKVTENKITIKLQ